MEPFEKVAAVAIILCGFVMLAAVFGLFVSAGIIKL